MAKKRVTRQQVMDEIIACGKDPIYFINKYAKIQHPVRGLIPFKTYDYQNDVIEAYLNNRYNIVLKARQLGLTTITAAYIAWLLLFHRDKNVLIVATKQETAKNSIRIIRNILKFTPKWIRDIAPIDVNNRHSIELENGSRVLAVATSTDVGRSYSPSFMVVDEAAHIPQLEEIWVGLGPAISEGGAVALLSTPNGTGNFFHTTYVQAKNKENNFNCTLGQYTNPENSEETYNDRLMWWVHPNHDQVWFDNETRGKSPREVVQEFLCNFNASGDTFIHHSDIEKMARNVREPEKTFHADRNVWIWEDPDPYGVYLIPADVSRGDAADYSTFHVLRIDCAPLRQVAEYKGKIRPDYLGILLMQVSVYYNNATVAPENNGGYSGQAIGKMEEANFPHIHYSKRSKPKTKDNWAPDPYYASIRNDYLPGYSVTSANRIPMLAKLEQYIRMGDIEINSPRFLEEVKTFIVKTTDRGERPEAQRGYNDDLVMALAGGLYVREEAYIWSYRSDEMTKAMLGGMSTSNTPASSFKHLRHNSNPYDRSRVQQHIEEQNKMVMANGDVVDLDWLLG